MGFSAESKFEREKRGDLATKLESLIHTVVEAMPGKVPKATLSQCAVTLGIAIDKTRILRGDGLEPDPGAEICKLLGINRAQLPTSLQLAPGEELPADLLAQYGSITASAIVHEASREPEPTFPVPPVSPVPPPNAEPAPESDTPRPLWAKRFDVQEA